MHRPGEVLLKWTDGNFVRGMTSSGVFQNMDSEKSSMWVHFNRQAGHKLDITAVALRRKRGSFGGELQVSGTLSLIESGHDKRGDR